MKIVEVGEGVKVSSDMCPYDEDIINVSFVCVWFLCQCHEKDCSKAET